MTRLSDKSVIYQIAHCLRGRRAANKLGNSVRWTKERGFVAGVLYVSLRRSFLVSQKEPAITSGYFLHHVYPVASQLSLRWLDREPLKRAESSEKNRYVLLPRITPQRFRSSFGQTFDQPLFLTVFIYFARVFPLPCIYCQILSTIQ